MSSFTTKIRSNSTHPHHGHRLQDDYKKHQGEVRHTPSGNARYNANGDADEQYKHR